MLTDSGSVDELDLSVLAEDACRKHGVRTVAELRAADLAKIGLGARRHRKAVAEALAKYDAQLKERYLRVLEAMRALTDEERARIHAEVGCCSCAAAAKFLVESPRVAIGAGLGALAAIFLGSEKPKQRSGA